MIRINLNKIKLNIKKIENQLFAKRIIILQF